MNPPTSWRDIADQLTPGQIAELQRCEHDNSTPRGLLNYARQMAAHSLAQLLHADIPAPPDAEQLGDWEDWTDADGRARPFDTGWFCPAGPVAVSISGLQLADGSVRRHIRVAPDDAELTPADARELAAALLAAADRIEAL